MLTTVILQNATRTPAVSARLTRVELRENATTRPTTASAPHVFALRARLGVCAGGFIAATATGFRGIARGSLFEEFASPHCPPYGRHLRQVPGCGATGLRSTVPNRLWGRALPRRVLTAGTLREPGDKPPGQAARLGRVSSVPQGAEGLPQPSRVTIPARSDATAARRTAPEDFAATTMNSSGTQSVMTTLPRTLPVSR